MKPKLIIALALIVLLSVPLASAQAASELKSTFGDLSQTAENPEPAFAPPVSPQGSLTATFSSEYPVYFEPPKPPEAHMAPLRLVALTFDDGPGGRVTPHILDTLEKYKVKATFFVLGSKLESHADIVRRAINLGCEIGNHTWDHSRLYKKNEQGILLNLNKTNEALNTRLNYPTALFRPSYGSRSGKILSAAKTLNMPVILWSVDTRDWENRSASKIYGICMKKIRHDSIVLMHDIHDCTADAMEIIVPKLIKQGYTFVTVSELFKLMGKSLTPGSIYRSG